MMEIDLTPAGRSAFIKKLAKEHGFLFAGITAVRNLDEEEDRLKNYLKENRHGNMHYMENHFELRLNPGKLVPGAKSIVSMAYNYFPAKKLPDDVPKISKYAYGRDYHKVVKKKLKTMLQSLKENWGDTDGRFFTDSAPVLEKKWAQLAGLGWMGKNTCIIHPKHGSYFFLCELIIDAECTYDTPFDTDHCGSCTRCTDACPTQALDTAYQINATRCISYLTIENKGPIPAEFKSKMQNWVFGCDICQDVCPWNRFSLPHKEPDFALKPEIEKLSRQEWLEMDEARFNDLFNGSPLKRAGYEGIQRNLKFTSETDSSGGMNT
jgi:epoxyqueuosine reductase